MEKALMTTMVELQPIDFLVLFPKVLKVKLS